jgi:LysR family transcriptional regulator of abg operon
MRDPDAFLIARLRFRHLELIEYLGEQRSIRKAAKLMHISEPAISKALAEIETSFGFALFDRSASGVLPTRRGDAVIAGARLLLNSLRHVRVSAAEADRGHTVRLGVAPFLALTMVPRLLQQAQFLDQKNRVVLREGTGTSLLQDLIDGQLDAIVVAMSRDVVDTPQAASLSYQVLYAELLAVIAKKGHRLAKRRKISWEDLQSERWILPPPPSMVESAIRTAYLAQGLVPPASVIMSAAPATNVALVGAGLGVSAVPRPMVAVSMLKESVEELRLFPQPPLPAISLIYRRDAEDAPAIGLLRMAIRSLFPGAAL